MNPEFFSPEVVRLARAVRFALVCLVLAWSYFTIRAVMTVPNFEQLFSDMLGGKPLPAPTKFVVRSYPVLFVGAYLIPSIAIGTLFSRRLVASFYVLGVLFLISFGSFLLMYQALSAPLFEIVSLMQGR